MNRMMRRKLLITIVVLAALPAVVVGVVAVQAQGPQPQSPQTVLGTGFTYQGQLKKSSIPVNDINCVMTFSLWDSQSNLSGQVGANQIITPVVVSGGLFTARVNGGNQFGPNAFTGSDRWLQADVQCTGDGSPVKLSRQQLAAAPYALSLRPGAVVSGSLLSNGVMISVVNTSITGIGIYGSQGGGAGFGAQSVGIWGDAASGDGVLGTSAVNGYGVEGISSGNIGVHGSGSPAGVQGVSTGFGVWGDGATAGVYGSSDNGPGLSGFSSTGNGVFGTSGITGVTGISSGSGPAYGVYGQTANGSGVTLLPTAGVWGDSSSGDGVAGLSNSGAGVYGAATSASGVGVWADGSGPTGTALKISNGAIKVPGAGISSTTPIFIHKATAATIPGGATQRTIIDNPLTNGDPNAILIITPNYNPGAAGNVTNNHATGVFYDVTLSKWGIYNVDLQAMQVNATFNVLVVKP
jgi:hypothetical protein